MRDRTCARFRWERLPAAIVLALIAAPALAAPGDMSVAAFLARANALKAKGPLALLSPDIKILQGEAQAAGMAYRAQLEAERKAGHPSSCPTHGARVNSDELLAQMNGYPAGKRPQITVKSAMADLFRAKFACH